jgi:hypothetical protein
VIGIRTDLAIEAREFYSKQEDKKDIPGVEVDMDKGENYTVTRVKVVEDVGARIMGKPKGNYITIEVPKLRENDKDLQDEAGKVLAGAETVNPKIPATVDAKAIEDMKDKWEEMNVVVQGPVALDLAISSEACAHKGFKGECGGKADILLVPYYEVGNALGKSMTYFAVCAQGVSSFNLLAFLYALSLTLLIAASRSFVILFTPHKINTFFGPKIIEATLLPSPSILTSFPSSVRAFVPDRYTSVFCAFSLALSIPSGVLSNQWKYTLFPLSISFWGIPRELTVTEPPIPTVASLLMFSIK